MLPGGSETSTLVLGGRVVALVALRCLGLALAPGLARARLAGHAQLRQRQRRRADVHGVLHRAVRLLHQHLAPPAEQRGASGAAPAP